MKKYKTYLHDMDIELTDKQIEQFDKYYSLMIEKNKVMNLTGITDYEEVLEKHFIDSLAIAKNGHLHGKVIDVGTGAGFPGIPLKIAYPELEVVLLDSLNKRIKFLDEVIDKLGLEKITTVHGRAEDLAQSKIHREVYDYAVSRAVANLSTLTEYCLPFVKIGGSFISYKSGEYREELNNSKHAISVLGGSVGKITEFELPSNQNARTLIVVKKESSTAKKYPRKAGLPSKEPI